MKENVLTVVENITKYSFKLIKPLLGGNDTSEKFVLDSPIRFDKENMLAPSVFERQLMKNV